MWLASFYQPPVSIWGRSAIIHARLGFLSDGLPGSRGLPLFLCGGARHFGLASGRKRGNVADPWLGDGFCPVRPYSHSVINLRATMDLRSNSRMKLRLQWKRGGSLEEPETPPLGPLTSDPVPQAFVDIHSHILWGIDDGSRSLKQSLAMLKVAADNGTSDIVATPHANCNGSRSFPRPMSNSRPGQSALFSPSTMKLQSGPEESRSRQRARRSETLTPRTALR